MSKNSKSHALYEPCPEPATELGRYRVLSSTAGVRVSPLALGAMSLGTAWQGFMGSVEDEQAFALLDAYADGGGNFIDTANNYQSEQSENLIGQWMEARGNRDRMFIATKFTFNYRVWELGRGGSVVNYAGNHKKSLHLSVKDSLRKLRTDYIDMLYVHWWDWTTSIEELMDSLHLLVAQGTVLYLGVSDTPAWVVAAANTYARSQGKTPFSVYQGYWNVMTRDFERDIIPMARHFGMALCPWGVLAQGKLQSREQIEARKEAAAGEGARGARQQTEVEKHASEVLEAIAAEVSVPADGGKTSIQQIALAYVLHKARNVFPIVGGRKVEHLRDNIRALSIRLTDEQIKRIEAIQTFDLGIPMNQMGDDPRETGAGNPIQESWAKIAWQKAPKPILGGSQ
ncbi:aryl-alcohol dehydrogenase [Xylariales sp. PMI_506]|nr:aryl-alcohol dehydrogenase [Xylariales sp. PMI_506]